VSGIFLVRHATFGLFALALAACGPPAIPATGLPPPVPKTSLDDAEWGTFHSARHGLSLALPDGHGWKIDDHSKAALVASHVGTGSRVSVQLARDDADLMNHAKCEEKARTYGFVPAKPLALEVIDEQEGIGKGGFDTHMIVGFERAQGALVGHVLSYGSFVKKCLWFHFETRVAEGHEAELSDRLVLAQIKVLGALSLDAFGEVPREPKR
jgi:hypothetical protein